MPVTRSPLSASLRVMLAGAMLWALVDYDEDDAAFTVLTRTVAREVEQACGLARCGAVPPEIAGPDECSPPAALAVTSAMALVCQRIDWMEPRVLTSSRAYFDEVLKPNRDAYFDGPVSFATAFNFATSLFHFHDWIFEDHRDRIITSFGLVPNRGSKITAGAFWSKVQQADQRFGYIRDVANASKHMVLTSGTSTGVKHIGQTSLTSVGFGMGAYGVGRYSGPNFVVLDGDVKVSFDDCAAAMLSSWLDLFVELTKSSAT